MAGKVPGQIKTLFEAEPEHISLKLTKYVETTREEVYIDIDDYL
jgi:hypothetical protein